MALLCTLVIACLIGNAHAARARIDTDLEGESTVELTLSQARVAELEAQNAVLVAKLNEVGQSDVHLDDTESSNTSQVPQCCSNPGCCGGPRQPNRMVKVKTCLATMGVHHNNRCPAVAQRLGVTAPMQENEVCCMCSKAKSPKTWFPVPRSMFLHGEDADADFRSKSKCQSKCLSLCTMAGVSDPLNMMTAAGLTMGIGMHDEFGTPLYQFATQVAPKAGGCFEEQYLAQLRGFGINVLANPDDQSTYGGSFANIC